MGDSHCTKLLPNNISSPNYVTNHESVCLSSVEARIVYDCVNNDVILSPDHFIGLPTEGFSTVYDTCEANYDPCENPDLIGLANFDNNIATSELHNPMSDGCLLNQPPTTSQLCALPAAEAKSTSEHNRQSEETIYSPNPYERVIINQSVPHSQNIFEYNTEELLQMINGDVGESDEWYMNAQAKPNVKGLVKWSILTNTIKYSSAEGNDGKLLALTSYQPVVNSKALRDNHLHNYSPPDYFYEHTTRDEFLDCYANVVYEVNSNHDDSTDVATTYLGKRSSCPAD